MKPILACAFALLLFTNSPLFAQKFESGINKVQLIELFTSEGCSSCPPADRWLSSLKGNDKLWDEIVPISFHVDYWDHIGWKDRFADHEFSQRQRRYAAEQKEAVVYTPGVRSNGLEWRGWRTIDLNNGHSELGPPEEVGNLVFNVAPNGEFTARFDSKQSGNAPLLTIAVLGIDLSSEVTRGENAGRKLKHDFVALNLSRYSMKSSSSSSSKSSSSSTGQWSGKLPPTKAKSDRYALAAWVSRGSNLIPIQSTGGYLIDTFSGF